MHLGLVGGFGNSISFRGMRFPSLEKMHFWALETKVK